MGGILNYGNGEQSININAVSDSASNIKTGTNPSFTLSDFYDVYPQFASNSNNNLIPSTIVQMYIDLADACIKQSRWHSYWQIATGWFVAHFCTLYLQGTADPNGGAGAVLEAGKARGLDTSESVDGVSVSTEYNSIGQDLDGWAAWKLTIYGQQLATIGKLVGKGGMYIY